VLFPLGSPANRLLIQDGETGNETPMSKFAARDLPPKLPALLVAGLLSLASQPTIAEFARVVAATVGFRGEIGFDLSRPDGTPCKLLDVSRLAKLGWRARTSLEEGIRLAYLAYLSETKQAAE